MKCLLNVCNADLSIKGFLTMLIQPHQGHISSKAGLFNILWDGEWTEEVPTIVDQSKPTYCGNHVTIIKIFTFIFNFSCNCCATYCVTLRMFIIFIYISIFIHINLFTWCQYLFEFLIWLIIWYKYLLWLILVYQLI